MGTLKSSEYAYRSAGDNFDTHPDYRHDMFTMCQEYAKNVSDISSGKAKKFLDRAYNQNYWHTADRLAAEQDKFLEDDMVNNTPGRGYRNYRRMEYDIPKDASNIGKSAVNDREAAEERGVWNKEELLRNLRQNRFAICSTASATSDKPITQKDYKDQIKL